MRLKILTFLLLTWTLSVSLSSWLPGYAQTDDPAPIIELTEAQELLTNYTFAETPKDRLPFVYLGAVSEKDFFTYYSGADRKFWDTKIMKIYQVNDDTFAVKRILLPRHQLSRFHYKLKYFDGKLLIDWETSLKKKFETRMDQIARKKKRDQKEFIENLIGDIGTVLAIGVGLIVFLLPTIIGIKKEHVKAIYAVNFLLLALLLLPDIGKPLAAFSWVGCLIWAITDRRRRKKRPAAEEEEY